MILKKIKDYFTYHDNGLFGYIQKELNTEWFTEDLAKYLNAYYFKINSGEKTASPSLEEMRSTIVLTEDNYLVENITLGDDITRIYEYLAHIIVATYGDKWEATYNALTLKYDLKQYYNETKINTPNVKITYQGKANVKTNVSSNSSVDNKVYGFDSGDTGAKSNSTTTNGSSETIENESDNNYERSSNEQGTRTTETSKNGGEVTERIKKYIELRKNTIVDIIIRDIDDLITIPIYQ